MKQNNAQAQATAQAAQAQASAPTLAERKAAAMAQAQRAADIMAAAEKASVSSYRNETAQAQRRGYVYTFTNENRTAELYRVELENATLTDAYKYAAAAMWTECDARAFNDTADECGLIMAALQIARRTIENTEYSTKTFTAMLSELDRAAAAVNRAVACGRGASVELFGILAELSQDAADIVSNAYTGILEQTNGAAAVYTDKDSGAEYVAAAAAYKRGYSAANTGVLAERRRADKEVSTEYIRESGGDIISISKYVGRMLSDTDAYIPTDTEYTDAETTARLSAFLSAVFAAVAPRQKRLMSLLARGYSVTQAADKIGVKRTTIYTHLQAIRRAAADILARDFSDISYYVNIDLVIAEQRKRADKIRRQTDARGAEYYRAYRAQKRAEKALQARGGITDAAAEKYEYNGAPFGVKNGGAAARTMSAELAAELAAAQLATAARDIPLQFNEHGAHMTTCRELANAAADYKEVLRKAAKQAADAVCIDSLFHTGGTVKNAADIVK